MPAEAPAVRPIADRPDAAGSRSFRGFVESIRVFRV